MGDGESRGAHREDLLKFYQRLDLDDATRARAQINPLRLFDDKRPEMIEAMADAPLLLDYLSKEAAANFDKVQRYLTELKIEFVINPRMVRGLDYYTGTTFEFTHSDLGAQSGIGGGGRYDGLMEILGGQPLSGIGFGLGVDRVLLAASAENVLPSQEFNSDLFLIPLGEEAKVSALRIADQLRQQGISTEIAFGDRALKGAMKAADKSGARFVIVLGDAEIAAGEVEVKRMEDGAITSVRIAQLPAEFQALLSTHSKVLRK